jgi:hypothetical protein
VDVRDRIVSHSPKVQKGREVGRAEIKIGVLSVEDCNRVYSG